MKSMMKLMTLSLFALCCFGLRGSRLTIDADNQAVNNACKADAQTAGCGNEVVGKGLSEVHSRLQEEQPEFQGQL